MVTNVRWCDGASEGAKFDGAISHVRTPDELATIAYWTHAAPSHAGRTAAHRTVGRTAAPSHIGRTPHHRTVVTSH